MRGVLLVNLSWRFVKTLAVMLFAITAVAFLIDFFSITNRAGGLPGYTILAGLKLSAIHMPSTVEAVVPFVVQFAAIALLSRLAQTRELVIFRSAGLSAFQFIAPLCAISLLFGVFSICILDPIAARSISRGRAVEEVIVGYESRRPSGEMRLWMTNSVDSELVVIGARKQRNGGLDLSDVTYLRFDSGQMAERVDAATASQVDDRLVFHDASHVVEGQNRNELVNRLSISSPFSQEAFREQFGDPHEVGFFDLRHAIASAREAGYAALPLEIRFFTLLCLPLLLVAMVLISAPISIRFERTGQSAMMIGSTVLSGYAVYATTVIVTALGSGGILYPVLAALVPVLVVTGIGVFWVLSAEDG
jgi:lipopolysaccharide export system permease protein